MSKLLVTHALHEKTRKNLLEAMRVEAFAYAKYMLFAQHARKSGREDIARLFEKTANVERFEHFAEEVELWGLVGSDKENLRNSIKGESHEVELMYKEFSKQAENLGDSAAAYRFSEIRADEKRHLASYRSALKKLRK